MCFLHRVFTINYVHVVQTYCKQKFWHAIVASLGIGAREVSRSGAAKACLAYRRTPVIDTFLYQWFRRTYFVGSLPVVP